MSTRGKDLTDDQMNNFHILCEEVQQLHDNRYGYNRLQLMRLLNVVMSKMKSFLLGCHKNNFVSMIRYVIGRGQRDLFGLLINMNPNFDDTDSVGNTLLQYATMSSSVEMLDKLVRERVDPDGVNNAGETALHAAVRNGYVHGVRVLLQMGANLFGSHATGNKTVLQFLQDLMIADDTDTQQTLRWRSVEDMLIRVETLVRKWVTDSDRTEIEQRVIAVMMGSFPSTEQKSLLSTIDPNLIRYLILSEGNRSYEHRMSTINPDFRKRLIKQAFNELYNKS